MIRRPPRSTPLYSSAASDVYKRQCIAKSVGFYTSTRSHSPSLSRRDQPRDLSCGAGRRAGLHRPWEPEQPCFLPPRSRWRKEPPTDWTQDLLGIPLIDDPESTQSEQGLKMVQRLSMLEDQRG